MSRIDRALNPDLYIPALPDSPQIAPVPQHDESAVLFVPAHPQRPIAGASPTSRPEAVFELLSGPEGPVPVAFTSLDLLVERLGGMQPWAAVSARQFVRLMTSLGIGPVHLDPQIDPLARRWSKADLDSYRRAG